MTLNSWSEGGEEGRGRGKRGKGGEEKGEEKREESMTTRHMIDKFKFPSEGICLKEI